MPGVPRMHGDRRSGWPDPPALPELRGDRPGGRHRLKRRPGRTQRGLGHIGHRLDLAQVGDEVVELDRAASAPADLLVNGTLIARGEVVVVDEDFGLRISEIVSDAAELGATA